MRTVSALAIGIVLAGTATTGSADEWTIRPSIPQIGRGNSRIMRPGSIVNPYVVEDSRGRQRGTITESVPDLRPGDGFMEPGSYSNPYRFEWDR